MRWGVRRYQNKDGSLTPRGKKHQAKLDYKEDRKNAKSKYRSSLTKATEDFNTAMSARNNKLAKIDEDYKKRKQATDALYTDELSRHERELEKAKSEMDFWDDPDSLLYQEAADRYSEQQRNITDVNNRWRNAEAANKLIRDNAKIKVSTLYADAEAKAIADRARAYLQASETYRQDIKTAKQVYRENKK